MQVNAVSKRPCRGIRSTATATAPAGEGGPEMWYAKARNARVTRNYATSPRACRASRRARETEQQHRRKFLDIDPRRRVGPGERTGRTNGQTDERTFERTRVAGFSPCAALIKLNCDAFLRRWRRGFLYPHRDRIPDLRAISFAKIPAYFFNTFADIHEMHVTNC